MKPIRFVCDFFSGLHCWTKPLNGLNVKIFSIDNNPEYMDHTTVIDDFLNLTAQDVIDYFGGRPHVIYASPPCTTFSVASIGAHWTGGKCAYIPKSEAAKKALLLVKHMVDLINELNPDYYFIENPRGVLRKLGILNNLFDIQRHTVWYCQYGETNGIKRAKPTDIWTNSKEWVPRPVCKNGNPECDHVRAPRGAKTGTQGMKGNAERSMIPLELCQEIANSWV
tara:strand:+ start:798 stop:1469 length:672 start_codon:yes stop_codon:yes gene_type:complete